MERESGRCGEGWKNGFEKWGKILCVESRTDVVGCSVFLLSFGATIPLFIGVLLIFAVNFCLFHFCQK